MSRTPLWESQKALAAEGLAQLIPNRGAIVALITEKELAGELVCKNAKDSDLQALRALHTEMIEHFRREEESAYRRLNRKFHQTLFDIAGNKALSELHEHSLAEFTWSASS